MASITTKRSISRFYLNAIVLLLFCVLFTCLTAYVFVHASGESTGEDGDAPREYFLGVQYTVILLPSCYAFYRFAGSAPKIKADENGIAFGKEKYLWKDLQEIQLTGKFDAGYLMPMSESAKLTFSDGTEKYIVDSRYSNTWQVKQFIKSVLESNPDLQSQPKAVGHLTSKDIAGAHFETFRGSPGSYRSVILIILVLLLAFFALVVTYHVISFVLLSTLLLAANARLMYYFRVSPDYLVVRNLFFLPYEKIYRMTDIREITFETHGRSSIRSMRIITNDFKTQNYFAIRSPAAYRIYSRQSWKIVE